MTRWLHSGAAPVYAENSAERPWSDATGLAAAGFEARGTMARSAYTHEEDDDFEQVGTLVHEVFDATRSVRRWLTRSPAVCSGVRAARC